MALQPSRVPAAIKDPKDTNFVAPEFVVDRKRKPLGQLPVVSVNLPVYPGIASERFDVAIDGLQENGANAPSLCLIKGKAGEQIGFCQAE